MTIHKVWGEAAHLTRALFAQDKIWVTAKSEILRIEDMEPTHVLNTLLMIERMDDIPVLDIQETPLYRAMYRRLEGLLTDAVQGDPPPIGFVMPNRRIATTRSEVLNLLESIGDRINVRHPVPVLRLHYRKENGDESHRNVHPIEVFKRHVGLGFPEVYLKGVDTDIAEIRQFRADRILRIEEVPD